MYAADTDHFDMDRDGHAPAGGLRDRIVDLLRAGKSHRRIVRELGCGKDLVRIVSRELRKSDPAFSFEFQQRLERVREFARKGLKQ